MTEHRKRSAYHEAGHVVGLIRAGARITSVALTADHGGNVVYRNNRADPHALAVAIVAGDLAVRHVSRLPLVPSPMNHIDKAALDELGGVDVAQACIEAARLVRREARAIHCVAGELLRHGSMTGERARDWFDLCRDLEANGLTTPHDPDAMYRHAGPMMRGPVRTPPTVDDSEAKADRRAWLRGYVAGQSARPERARPFAYRRIVARGGAG